MMASPMDLGWYDSTAPGHYTDDNSTASSVVVAAVDRTGISIQLPTGYFIKGKVTNSGGTRSQASLFMRNRTRSATQGRDNRH